MNVNLLAMMFMLLDADKTLCGSNKKKAGSIY
jgi:hypothetical protein